jgi:hypothetical protein
MRTGKPNNRNYETPSDIGSFNFSNCILFLQILGYLLANFMQQDVIILLPCFGGSCGPQDFTRIKAQESRIKTNMIAPGKTVIPIVEFCNRSYNDSTSWIYLRLSSGLFCSYREGISSESLFIIS